MAVLLANWKMNHGPAAANAFVRELNEYRALLNRADEAGLSSWFAPPAISIPYFADLQIQRLVRVGGQNVHWKDSGAFTGELSRAMLSEIGCTFAIVGHSERRHQHGEDDAQVIERALANLVPGFTIVFCVGESSEQRARGETNSVLRNQLTALLNKITPDQARQLIIAYEPVWAIGTGVAAQSADIVAAHGYIGEACGDISLPILYGGSVNAKNVKEILALPTVAGVLVGSASLTVSGWTGMIEAALES